MKKPLSIRLDEPAWSFVKNKSNKSRYLQGLVTQDIQMQQMKPIVKAVAEELLGNEAFVAEISKRAGATPVQQLTRPTLKNSPEPFVPRPPDPVTGYPCCTQPNGCKHWVWQSDLGVRKNTLTGQTKESDV